MSSADTSASETSFESALLDRIGSFVGGAWLLADGGPTFEVRDPANAELLARVPEHGATETEAAVEAAAGARSRVGSLDERRAWLTSIAALLEQHTDELANIVTRENGKPLAEARGEVRYAAAFYAQAAADIEHLAPRVLAAQPRGHRWTVHHRPAGVAALITPWNFPIAMLAKKLSAAIAGGCPSVVKPAEATPLTCIAFFRLLERVDMPRGMVNLVCGDAESIGGVLSTHPAVRIVSFTGSTRVGRILAQQAAPHLKRLSLELGGNAPCLVFDDALFDDALFDDALFDDADLDDADLDGADLDYTRLDAAVERLVANKFRASGQTCVCTNRVFVQRRVHDEFAKRLARRVSKLVVGPGSEPGVDLGPLISGAGWDKVREHVEDALSRGATIAHGALPSARPEASEGWFFEPIVLQGVPPDAACMREETFGPLLPIGSFETEAEAIALANDVDAGLAAYVFTAHPERGERVAAALHFGHVGLNTGTGPTPEAPFGGMGESGYGREGGPEGLLEYVEAQTVATPLPPEG